MTGRAMTLSVGVLVVTLAVASGLSCGGTSEETKKPTIDVPGEKVREVARKVGSGEADVGSESGLQVGGRYHNIHTAELDMECADCHLSEPSTTQTVFFAQDGSPQAPGAVDRQVCLQCHQGGGASDLYGSDDS